VARGALLAVIRLECHRCLLLKSRKKTKGAPVARCPQVCSTPRRSAAGGSDRLQIDRRGLAALRIALLLEGNLLALVQAVHASALNGRDVDEHVRPAAFRLDKAVTLGAIEPFHRSEEHTSELQSRE